MREGGSPVLGAGLLGGSGMLWGRLSLVPAAQTALGWPGTAASTVDLLVA
jgi:hypothetical protein